MSSVDVVVPCYNYGHYLESCVSSVLAQKDVAVRVFVVDDCSTDDTAEIGERLAAGDPRVHFKKHARNMGHIATYNETLVTVTADYCVLLSPDDQLTRGSLARATRVMDAHPEVGLTYGRDLTFFDVPPTDAEARAASTGQARFYSYADFLALACRLCQTPLQAPTVVVRTALHHAIGYYLPELPHTADTEIWLRMAASGDVCALDDIQAFRRLHKTNMSLGFSPLRRLDEQRKAFEEHFRQFIPVRPEIVPLRAVMRRAIAEQAFWSGVRAFEAGKRDESEAFLEFSAGVAPDIVEWKSWKRFEWKRRLAPARVWQWVAQHGARS